MNYFLIHLTPTKFLRAPLETSHIQIFVSGDFVYFVYSVYRIYRIMQKTPPSRDRLKQQLQDCDLLSGTDSGTLDRVKHRFALQHAKQINENATSRRFASLLADSCKGSMDYSPSHIQDNLSLTDSYLSKRENLSSDSFPKNKAAGRNLFSVNAPPIQNPGEVNHTVPQKDRESQWDTIPKKSHDSEAHALHVLGPTCKIDRTRRDGSKEGRCGISKCNWKTRLSHNLDNGQWCTQFVGFHAHPIISWAEHLSDSNSKKGLPPLIDAAVLECMQKSSSANAEPKEVSCIVMNQFLDSEEMKEPKTSNILIGKILNRVRNLNKRKYFEGIKSLEMSCDIKTYNEKFKLLIPPGYVFSIPKTQSELKVIMENLKSNGMNTLPPQRTIKEGKSKGGEAEVTQETPHYDLFTMPFPNDSSIPEMKQIQQLSKKKGVSKDPFLNTTCFTSLSLLWTIARLNHWLVVEFLLVLLMALMLYSATTIC